MMSSGARSVVREDIARRSPNIRWPTEFRPENAAFFVHNELLIDAPCHRVWNRITDVQLWPAWYPNATSVQLLDGASRLDAGTRWRWTTFGFGIESRVSEYATSCRLGWYSYSPGYAPVFYTAWLLQPQASSCLVTLEKSGVGLVAADIRHADEGLIHSGHELWLTNLKWVSEDPQFKAHDPRASGG